MQEMQLRQVHGFGRARRATTGRCRRTRRQRSEVATPPRACALALRERLACDAARGGFWPDFCRFSVCRATRSHAKGWEARTMLCVLPTPHHDRRKSSRGPRSSRRKITKCSRHREVERLVETTGKPLETHVESALWRSVGLDRGTQNRPYGCSGKRSQINFFAQSPRQNSKNRPKTTQKWPNFPCSRLSDTWIPCAERRRSPENDARIP